MKRIGNLYEKFISDENWILAHYNATHNKKSSRAIKRAKKKPVSWVLNLRDSVADGSFKFEGYKEKILYEPKKRVIKVAKVKERILHWALMQVIEPIFERTFVKDSYSCRKGKGQLKASHVTMKYVKRNSYCLKLDISKFYPSINQEILKKCLSKKLKDPQVLYWLFQVIDTCPDRGVPIGNYTSQIFGNIYMTQLDYYVKQILRCKDYIRYCDDFLLFGTKEQCQRWRVQLTEFVINTLDMKLSKCRLFSVSLGVDFVGYRHFKTKILLRKRIVKRLKVKVKKLWNKVSYVQRDLSVIASMIGFIKHCYSYSLLTKYNSFNLFKLIKEELKEMKRLSDLQNTTEKNPAKLTLNDVANKEVIITRYELFTKSEYENPLRAKLYIKYKNKPYKILTSSKLVIDKLTSIESTDFPISAVVAKKLSSNGTTYYTLL